MNSTLNSTLNPGLNDSVIGDVFLLDGRFETFNSVIVLIQLVCGMVGACLVWQILGAPACSLLRLLDSRFKSGAVGKRLESMVVLNPTDPFTSFSYKQKSRWSVRFIFFLGEILVSIVGNSFGAVLRRIRFFFACGFGLLTYSFVSYLLFGRICTAEMPVFCIPEGGDDAGLTESPFWALEPDRLLLPVIQLLKLVELRVPGGKTLLYYLLEGILSVSPLVWKKQNRLGFWPFEVVLGAMNKEKTFLHDYFYYDGRSIAVVAIMGFLAAIFFWDLINGAFVGAEMKLKHFKQAENSVKSMLLPNYDLATACDIFLNSGIESDNLIFALNAFRKEKASTKKNMIHTLRGQLTMFVRGAKEEAYEISSAMCKQYDLVLTGNETFMQPSVGAWVYALVQEAALEMDYQEKTDDPVGSIILDLNQGCLDNRIYQEVFKVERRVPSLRLEGSKRKGGNVKKVVFKMGKRRFVVKNDSGRVRYAIYDDSAEKGERISEDEVAMAVISKMDEQTRDSEFDTSNTFANVKDAMMRVAKTLGNLYDLTKAHKANEERNTPVGTFSWADITEEDERELRDVVSDIWDMLEDGSERRRSESAKAQNPVQKKKVDMKHVTSSVAVSAGRILNTAVPELPKSFGDKIVHANEVIKVEAITPNLLEEFKKQAQDSLKVALEAMAAVTPAKVNKASVESSGRSGEHVRARSVGVESRSKVRKQAEYEGAVVGCNPIPSRCLGVLFMKFQDAWVSHGNGYVVSGDGGHIFITNAHSNYPDANARLADCNLWKVVGTEGQEAKVCGFKGSKYTQDVLFAKLVGTKDFTPAPLATCVPKVGDSVGMLAGVVRGDRLSWEASTGKVTEVQFENYLGAKTKFCSYNMSTTNGTCCTAFFINGGVVGGHLLSNLIGGKFPAGMVHRIENENGGLVHIHNLQQKQAQIFLPGKDAQGTLGGEVLRNLGATLQLIHQSEKTFREKAEYIATVGGEVMREVVAECESVGIPLFPERLGVKPDTKFRTIGVPQTHMFHLDGEFLNELYSPFKHCRGKPGSDNMERCLQVYQDSFVPERTLELLRASLLLEAHKDRLTAVPFTSFFSDGALERMAESLAKVSFVATPGSYGFNQYHTTSELLEAWGEGEEGVKEFLEHALEMGKKLEKGGNLADFYTAIMKADAYSIKKIKTQAWRVVLGSSLLTKVLWIYCFGDSDFVWAARSSYSNRGNVEVDEDVKNASRFHVGIPPAHPVRGWRETIAMTATAVQATDAEQWDTRMPKAFSKAVFHYYFKVMCPGIPDPVLSYFCENFLDCLVVLPAGKVVQLAGGEPSGNPATLRFNSVLNSALSALAIAFACSRLRGGCLDSLQGTPVELALAVAQYVGCSGAWAEFKGDDNRLWIRTCEDPLKFFEKYNEYWRKEFPWNIKIEGTYVFNTQAVGNSVPYARDRMRELINVPPFAGHRLVGHFGVTDCIRTPLERSGKVASSILSFENGVSGKLFQERLESVENALAVNTFLVWEGVLFDTAILSLMRTFPGYFTKERCVGMIREAAMEEPIGEILQESSGFSETLKRKPSLYRSGKIFAPLYRDMNLMWGFDQDWGVADTEFTIAASFGVGPGLTRIGKPRTPTLGFIGEGLTIDPTHATHSPPLWGSQPKDYRLNHIVEPRRGRSLGRT